MRFGSLFAGIGGFDLGLERAGMTCAWQVKIDDYATKVLEKHWPNVKRYRDVREVGAHNLEPVDLICGGFPCQDISHMGHRVGIDGDRSGLWTEFFRIICELRPPFVLVENVSALLGRGIERVLGDLASRGYDAEWECLPAAAFGAPHIRDRIWILAYGGQEFVVNIRKLHGGRYNLLQQGNDRTEAKRSKDRELIALVPGIHPGTPSDWWRHQSGVDRTANGLPGQLDRLGCLGNAVVPQIVEWIGRRIMNFHVIPHGGG